MEIIGNDTPLYKEGDIVTCDHPDYDQIPGEIVTVHKYVRISYTIEYPNKWYMFVDEKNEYLKKVENNDITR